MVGRKTRQKLAATAGAPRALRMPSVISKLVPVGRVFALTEFSKTTSKGINSFLDTSLALRKRVGYVEKSPTLIRLMSVPRMIRTATICDDVGASSPQSPAIDALIS